jgi:uncharacterized protein
MRPVIFEAAVNRFRDHCLRSGQKSVRITFHGGEPCLAGVDRFAKWCETARNAFENLCHLELSIQTNGTLIDDSWAKVFQHYKVSVGVSLDGPQDINDSARVDHAKRGSYTRIVRGLNLLVSNKVPVHVLCVIQFGADGLRVHQHFMKLGIDRINYLFPDFTHDTIGSVYANYGPTPCADYMLPILEEWWAKGSIDTRIALFWNMARVILGGKTQIDVLGNPRYEYVFVETDGTIEGLDVLKICGGKLASTRLHILRDDFAAIAETSPLHRQVMFEGLALPTGCQACPERSTCAGGYLPHRYSLERGFDNRTIWCQDMLRLFGRMRELLNVTVQGTSIRRSILEELMANGS